MKRFGILSLMILFIITGCSLSQATVAPTPDINATVRANAATVFAQYTQTSAAAIPTITQTSTVPQATSIPSATSTSAPIPAPVDAVASNNVTVRAEPRKGAKNVGGIFFNQSMKVIARNDIATWYYIVWTGSPTGTAWVLASAVNMKENDPTHLPIAIIDNAKKVTVLPPFIWNIPGTPLPIPGPAVGAQTALIKELAKVRVGPGIGYSNMGTIAAGVTVSVTGHTDGNGWVQIDYPSGPGGHGWLAGELLQMKGSFAGLPVYNLLATPVSDAAPADNAPTLEPNTTSEATPTTEPTPAGLIGQVTAAQLNVHSGPASSFANVGMLNLGTSVVITGKTVNGLWYQIAYAAAPNGYGYVSPKYIKITGGDMTRLKYLNDLGTPLP